MVKNLNINNCRIIFTISFNLLFFIKSIFKNPNYKVRIDDFCPELRGTMGIASNTL
uniref:Uncharacterized protein n=1 Tax=Romanomermis culicivorax TaxID=13658 RepID=A0A915HRN1_ROMCU